MGFRYWEKKRELHSNFTKLMLFMKRKLSELDLNSSEVTENASKQENGTMVYNIMQKLQPARKIASIITSVLVAGGMAIAVPSAANALSLKFDSYYGSTNSPGTGASAEVDFVFTDLGGTVQLDLNIANITNGDSLYEDPNTPGDDVATAGATGSRFMGFGLDYANGDLADIFGITNSDYTGDSFFGNLIFDDSSINGAAGNGTMAGTSFNDITFDIGFGNKSTLMGNGNPNSALGAGDSTTVSLILDTSPGFDDAATIETWFEEQFNQGNLVAGARFKDVNAGAGSDKLFGGIDNVPTIDASPGGDNPGGENPGGEVLPPTGPGTGGNDDGPVKIPEPSMMAALGLLAAAGVFGVGKKKKKM